MPDTKLSGLPTGSAIADADLFYSAQGGASIRQPATAFKTYITTALSTQGVFNVKAYGAVGNGIADDSAAVQAAIDAAELAGGGCVYFPHGTYPIGTFVLPCSNLYLLGDGRGVSVLTVPTGNSTTNALVKYLDVNNPLSNITVEHLSFYGQWNTFRSAVSDNALVTFKACSNVTVNDCEFKYSRAFSLQFNECNDVIVTNCRISFSVRDMIAVWDTPNVTVTNNHLTSADDDGISLHHETLTTFPVRSRVVVANNILQSCGGITGQALKETVITGNVLFRCFGNGISLAGKSVQAGYWSGIQTVEVSNNLILDMIDRIWVFSGVPSGWQQITYIRINSAGESAGSLDAVPGENVVATGEIQSPFDYFYSLTDASNVGALRPPTNIIIKNNVLKRTLPAVAAYSDWGYGPCFYSDGFRDTAVADELLIGGGIEVRIPQRKLTIEGNYIDPGGLHGIIFTFGQGVTATADNLVREMIIRGNKICGVTSEAISWPGTAEDGLSYQDILVEDNFIDCDPNMKSSVRKTGPIDGTWTVDSIPIGLNFPWVGGIVMRGNTVKNTNRVFYQQNASHVQQVFNNYIICDPAHATFSTDNKGCGTLAGVGNGEQWWIIPEDCDPSSATFGQSLGYNPKNSASMPITGKWLLGTFVSARGNGSAPLSGQTLGWYRLTTGTGNTAGTDWVQVGGIYEDGGAPVGSPNGLRLRTSGGTTPQVEAWGSATNISVQLTPKGSGFCIMTAPVQLPTYTVSTLPTAGNYPRCIVYVSDGTANKRLAISDSTNWRFPDGAIVS